MKNQYTSGSGGEPEDKIARFGNAILEDIETVHDSMRRYELMNLVKWRCNTFEIKYPDEIPRIRKMKKDLLCKLGDPY